MNQGSAGRQASLERTGLSHAQVAEQIAAGQVNDQGRQPTRTVSQILVANIATRFNAILGGLFVVIAIVGPLQDGLFGLVLIANSGVGIVQELRAKRTLDRLTVLNAPTAAVLRDGVVRQIPAAEVVLDDVVELQSGQTVDAALRGSVAGLVGMVPEGLVLLTSVAMAVGVVRLAARRVLVQDLPAIEGLARVDVVCCDKTGTLTQGSMHVVSVITVGADAGAEGEAEAALGALAAAESRPNATMRALADGFADPGWDPSQVVAFSSARKWSAASYDGKGTWLIGSPDTILAAARRDGRGAGDGQGNDHGIMDQAANLAGEGYRVLLLARADGHGGQLGILAGAHADGQTSLPDGGQSFLAGTKPVALVTLQERLRPDAQATLDYFASQGVSVRVLSGDHPATVAAIARRLGLRSADAGAGHVLDAR